MLSAIAGDLLQGFRAPGLAGLIALIVSFALTPAVRRLAISRGAIDDPRGDDRRIHKEPIPRWGGLAIFTGILVALLAILPFAYPTVPFPYYLIGMLGLGAAIVVVGALDDLYQYKAKVQALFLLLCGVTVQLMVGPYELGRVQIQTIKVPLTDTVVHLGYWAIPLTAFYIFVVTKTTDTIDGVDGLAAGIATITATTLTIIAVYGEQPRVAIIAAAIAGAALGFLRHNYNPAKIFMGTGGAQLLGFLLACLSIVGALKTAATLALLIPLLVFGVPIFDAFFVITRRIASRQPITQADKRHLHHTLLGKGLTQRQTVWVMYAMTAALCAVAFLAIKSNG